jgi:hypothetical protein
MNALTIIDSDTGAIGEFSRGWFEDPLDADQAADAEVRTTRRGLTRVALIAAETGARFQREGADTDPMAWMLAPRRLFGGTAAIEACLDRDHFMRGLILHGLSLGLDLDPADIDELMADGAGRPADVEGSGVNGPGVNGRPARLGPADLRLFTATVVVNDGRSSVQAFHASLATDPEEVAGRIARRLGMASIDVRIMAGFDPTDPLVAALVSDVLCDTLALIAAEPGSPLAAGLDLTIEQRFDG